MNNLRQFTIAATLALTPALLAQQPVAGILQHRNTPVASTPVLGYVLENEAAGLRPILGTALKPRLGDTLLSPAGTRRLYLPPFQQFAAVEREFEPMAIWVLLRTAAAGMQTKANAISGAMEHPDLVAFSPRGQAAALYSKSLGRIQVVKGLPVNPHIERELVVLADAAHLAISDDATFIASDFAGSNLSYSSDGGQWQPISGQYAPAAWSFVPNSHDLVISDPRKNVIALYREAHGSPQFISMTGIAADKLNFTKDGSQLIAEASNAGLLWSINLKEGGISQLSVPGKIDGLASLRDGQTFLLSASPAVSLLSLAVGVASIPSQVPASIQVQ